MWSLRARTKPLEHILSEVGATGEWRTGVAYFDLGCGRLNSGWGRRAVRKLLQCLVVQGGMVVAQILAVTKNNGFWMYFEGKVKF